MTRQSWRGWAVFGLLALVCLTSAQSAEVAQASVAFENTLDIDLAPKIDVAMLKRERFAVDVPHAVDPASAGSWERASGTSVWRYSVRIPSAVSMSFHAALFRLPSESSLAVTDAAGARALYSPGDGGELGLWSRVARGDSLRFELRVPTRDESQVVFAIASLQAGYRVLGGEGADHPHYRKRLAASPAALNAACTENFACHETPQNSRNADATAAIVIGGVALCTATLINNVRNDGTPYLLTARHCQDNPSSGVVVYWDAVKPCGAVLGSVYDTQTGAYLHSTETVFEQQDVWMLRLTSPVNALRPFFSGWDATGATFVGGYSPHHALGRSRQYTEWFGQAFQETLSANTLGLGYDSTFWGLVNSAGHVGSGASGGGLFNPEHRLVGIASLAYIDGSGEGVCPATSPPAPDPITKTAMYNALSAVWETNADTTSATNPVTLKSLLDPDNSGARVLDGFQMLAGVQLFSDHSYRDTGRRVTLSWTGGNAASCTGTGGVPGDGWAGARVVSGTYELTQYQAGLTTYTVRCTDGVRFAIRSVRVHWNLALPSLLLSLSETTGTLGNEVQVFWDGTALPCVASGGRTGDGWAGTKPATGNIFIPLLEAGETTYTMTCGTGPAAAMQSFTLTAFAPIATLTPNTTSMRIGNEILVTQAAGGAECVRTGGAPGDGWTAVTGSYPLRLKTAVAGSYHYTLTCSGGPNGTPSTATATMDLTFTNDSPAVTLTPSATTAETGVLIPADNPTDGITFTWLANVAPCQLSFDGPGPEDGPAHPSKDFPASASFRSSQVVVGTYVYRIECGLAGDIASTTTSVDFVPRSTRVDLFRDTTVSPARDQPIQLYWFSDTSPCVASGGDPGDGWAGAQSSGAPYVTLRAPGTYVYTMTCGSAPDEKTASLSIVIPPPALDFAPHPTEVLMNVGVNLQWNGTVGNCVFTHDWSSPIEPRFANGSNIASATSPGLKTFGLRCGLSNFIEATTQINFLPVPVVDITASVASANVNQPVTLTWASTFADDCAVDGAGTADWAGILPTSGSRTVTRATPGATGYYINCGGVVDAVVVEWRSVTASPQTPAAPSVTFSIDQSTRVAGEPVTLTWTTTRAAACRAAMGASGDGWVGALPVTGTRTIIINTAGSYTWEIACQGVPPAATARVTATYSAAPQPPPPGGGSSSGGGGGSSGGGGGRVDLTLLALFGVLSALRALRRKQLEIGRRRAFA